MNENKNYLDKITVNQNYFIAQKILSVEEMKLNQSEYIRNLLNILQEADSSESLLHLEMVGKLSYFLCRKLGKDIKESKEIEIYAKLHDIGKIGVPVSILNKSGKFTEKEFEVMKTHTEIGYQLVEKLNIPKIGKDIIRYHHEKWDGSGYTGFKSHKIPKAARIVALADVYDALRMKRPYKDSMSHEKAVEIISRDRGKHFDPEIVDIFLNSHQEIRNIYNTFLN